MTKLPKGILNALESLPEASWCTVLTEDGKLEICGYKNDEPVYGYTMFAKRRELVFSVLDEHFNYIGWKKVYYIGDKTEEAAIYVRKEVYEDVEGLDTPRWQTHLLNSKW